MGLAELREEEVLAGARPQEFIFKLGAVIGKQPTRECVCLHKPWGLDERGPQLAGGERIGTGTAGLPVCACLCPGGFGCGAKDGQIQIIARLRQGGGSGEDVERAFLQTPPGRCGALPLLQHQSALGSEQTS